MVVKYVNGDFKDAEVWYDAGRRVLDGDGLAGLPHYRYPPAFAVLIAPLCALGLGPFYFLWYAINVGLFGLLFLLTRSICFPQGQPPPPWYPWLPALLVAPFAVDNLVLGQTNILITVLVYWALLEDSRGRWWRSGIPLGAAIAIKAFPAPLVVYLLYRGRLRASLAAVLSCAFFLLVLPALVRGPQRNLREVEDWRRRVVAPYLSRGEAGDWGQHALDFRNQSLSAVAGRYLTHVDAQVMAKRGRPIFINVADLAPGQVYAAVLGLFAAMSVGFAVACGPRGPLTQTQLAAEYALASLLLLLVSAVSWTYFFVMLLLPVTVSVLLLDARDQLRPGPRRMLQVGFWAVPAAAVLLASDYARALGNLCWAAVLLFLALSVACWDLRRSRPATS
jgi:hypothetical protein